jgi:hypothetical protein
LTGLGLFVGKVIAAAGKPKVTLYATEASEPEFLAYFAKEVHQGFLINVTYSNWEGDLPTDILKA